MARPTMPRPVRPERSAGTRDAILVAAERLFAERGLTAVSNRQVSEAAGQGNNAAVGYHFGTKTDLVRAIVRRHEDPIGRRRRAMVDAIGMGGTDGTARDWIACWVRPLTDHLAAQGGVTWVARFGAQAMADPAYRQLILDESFTDRALYRILDGLNGCCASMPVSVRLQRNYMTRQLVVHMLADWERVLAEGHRPPLVTWDAAAGALIDALVGLWLAPVTPLTGGTT